MHLYCRRKTEARAFELDARLLVDANAIADEAQAAIAAVVAARDQLRLPDLVQVHDLKVDDGRQVRKLLQNLHARQKVMNAELLAAR